MYEESVRDMNDQERKELVGRLDGVSRPTVTLRYTLKRVAVWLGGFLICGALEIALFTRMEVYPVAVTSILMGLVLVVMIVCLYAIIALTRGHVHWALVKTRDQHSAAPRVREAIDQGRVSVKAVTASEVVAIEEYEDEGCGYIFDVGDGNILFLKGQEYFPVSETMEWPNSRFEIVRSEDGSVWVGIFCFGEKLVPKDVIPSSRCREEIIYAHREEVLEGNLHEFCSGLTVA